MSVAPENLARAIVAQLARRSPALAIRFADAAQEAAAEYAPKATFQTVRDDKPFALDFV